ncbi:unnamed protein product [Malassezia sympodialis ATCC 42132]|uniref:Similar to S.cerevisiae protein MRPL31 (Mitochondrial ribosomal protein of the large subunit) n=1 Tax=Malassezia sympodialis (strain ATCC 42132) TaxID=1230383 RepID=M5ENH8_MALS4|nr:uncharacterized protein MSY001_1948 [Malassezia sympodialis ATCC 42132]CCU99242.1 unnamed protein product [Malassezia sympodialis ATCC 42132]SHO78501.1 Similar to S.cerevisiae protein MRPL31 (Mitochondrial ribosomal protein of the large subunit) [Malassezia sympodialis ATCC 42132]|eukprot:XP_018740503.1 uncharacterized protein MSY001_1948 [Malassezia sympodialis ATCC 42132]
MSFLGAFRPSSAALGGLLWKNPWRLSSPRKARVRQRLRDVDMVIETVRASGVTCSALERDLKLPKENDMHSRDKYTIFSPTGVNFRKSVHKVPKWTRKTLRVNPRGF